MPRIKIDEEKILHVGKQQGYNINRTAIRTNYCYKTVKDVFMKHQIVPVKKNYGI